MKELKLARLRCTNVDCYLYICDKIGLIMIYLTLQMPKPIVSGEGAFITVNLNTGKYFFTSLFEKQAHKSGALRQDLN
jgi:hypothetical protein